MKLSSALLLSPALTSVLANPIGGPGDLQTVLGDVHRYSDLANGYVEEVADELRKAAVDIKGQVEKWVQDGREFIQKNDRVYELLSHPLFEAYQLRVTEPQLCDPDVKQKSGYLDVTDGKHLFFWFFEARTAPEEAPLLLWLNGGPGCSSSTGLLFELGPCRIADKGTNTTYNPHSWTEVANVIFLDQPIDVGFSYSDDGSKVSTSPVAGEDVYAFLQLFLKHNPKYAKAPFHLAAESYGGTYGPNFASIIHKKNKELALAPIPDLAHINLASLMIGNGLTDPHTQFALYPEYECNGPYPIYEEGSAECESLRSKVPTCQRLIETCYNYNSRLTCVPAALYCNSQIIGPFVQLGLNPYDVRRKCDREKDGDLCYQELEWIEDWMNDPKVQKELGVDPDMNFQSCNMDVNRAFLMQGDGMHNHAALLPEMINDGVRLLIYAGNADFICNYMGNEAWMDALEHDFHEEFIATKKSPWTALTTGKVAGFVRAAGGKGHTAGNVTFVEVFEAGHMVPFDQPEASLDLVNRWLLDVPLSGDIADAIVPF